MLLEARSAKNRSALRWLEWDRSFRAAFRTGGTRFCAHAAAACAFRFALFAVFGIVLELFIVKKQLLARSEDKLGATVTAL